MAKYIVGLSCDKRSRPLIVEDDNALLEPSSRAEYEYPDATITYVRKSNRRGDRRHPHQTLALRPKGKLG